MSKRLLLANTLQTFGVLRLVESFRSDPGIVVVNHHRIGNAETTRFDRGVYSATTEMLDEQISLLKRRMPIVAGEELESLVTGKRPLTRTFGVLTFDDGYLDNYTNAFPVLKHHDVPAIFFPVIQYAGTSTVTWWDEIAYLMRNSQTGKASVSTPVPLELELGQDREFSILQMLRHFKRPDNLKQQSFLQQLRESTGCSVPDPGRRFLNWNEAREMVKAGMEFGSHSCSHTILSQQTEDEQRWELKRSKVTLEQELDVRIHSIAYPVGSATAFTTATQTYARDAGYTIGFSLQGGWNRVGHLTPMCMERLSPSTEHSLFRMQINSRTQTFAH